MHHPAADRQQISLAAWQGRRRANSGYAPDRPGNDPVRRFEAAAPSAAGRLDLVVVAAANDGRVGRSVARATDTMLEPKRGVDDHGDDRAPGVTYSGNPWNALGAMMICFFMIMLDSTIVAIANPTIMARLHTGYDTVVWVTSAYLLGLTVVLLMAGRLGDRFGPKDLYLIGLVVFTAASAWCGLSGSAAMLIAARVVQGVGAGMLTPQTLSTITRIFPPQRRGVAMSVWGARPPASPAWWGRWPAERWSTGWARSGSSFVNVPIGVVGLALAFGWFRCCPPRCTRWTWSVSLCAGSACS
jgi:hypothetical protein